MDVVIPLRQVRHLVVPAEEVLSPNRACPIVTTCVRARLSCNAFMASAAIERLAVRLAHLTCLGPECAPTVLAIGGRLLDGPVNATASAWQRVDDPQQVIDAQRRFAIPCDSVVSEFEVTTEFSICTRTVASITTESARTLSQLNRESSQVARHSTYAVARDKLARRTDKSHGRLKTEQNEPGIGLALVVHSRG